MSPNKENIVNILNGNGIVVMPTDTLYGIVGKALNPRVVERIYQIRKRTPSKPCIILIGDISELGKFLIVLNQEEEKTLKEYWGKPHPVSIVLDCPEERFSYLHRGTKTLAFRIPHPNKLKDLLLKTGPLIAPSSNIEGMPPAQNIASARQYFGDSVDLYVDGGIITGSASKIIKLHKDGSVSILRE